MSTSSYFSSMCNRFGVWVGFRKRHRRKPATTSQERQQFIQALLSSALLCFLTYHILHFLAHEYDGCNNMSNCYCNNVPQSSQPFEGKCYSLDIDGCPRERKDRLDSRPPHPLSNIPKADPTDIRRQDTTQRCHSTLGRWMVDKFPDLNPESDAAELLRVSSCKYLIYSEEEATAFIEKFISSNSWQEQHRTYPDFVIDLKNEIADSIRVFLSYSWDQHPLFENTLPADHPLLTSRPEIDNSPERTRWREQVVSKTLSPGKPVLDRKPKLIILGGGGGSGKSSVLTTLRQSGRFVPQEGYVLVNPDDIKVMDPIYVSIRQQGDYRAADVVHNESESIARIIFNTALESHFDIIFDGTFSEFNRSVTLAKAAKAAGYEVILIGVTVDPLTALQRSNQRAILSKRLVPCYELLKAHKYFSVNFERYVEYVDHLVLFDNNRANSPPVELAYKTNSTNSRTRLEILDRKAYNAFKKKAQLNELATSHNELYPKDENEFDLFGRCVTRLENQHRYARLLLALQDRNNMFCLCSRSAANLPTYFEVRSLLGLSGQEFGGLMSVPPQLTISDEDEADKTDRSYDEYFDLEVANEEGGDQEEDRMLEELAKDNFRKSEQMNEENDAVDTEATQNEVEIGIEDDEDDDLPERQQLPLVEDDDDNEIETEGQKRRLQVLMHLSRSGKDVTRTRPTGLWRRLRSCFSEVAKFFGWISAAISSSENDDPISTKPASSGSSSSSSSSSA